MMAWRIHRDTASAAENLSYPPGGGRIKLVIMGILLPAVIGFFAVDGLIGKEAIWFGQDENMAVTGRTAQAISVAYLGVAFLCHIRWVWGLLGFYRVFEIGTILSTLAIIGGVAMSIWLEFGFSTPRAEHSAVSGGYSRSLPTFQAGWYDIWPTRA